MASATVCVTYDFDALSFWLHSMRSWDSPTDHSRGLFGVDVGVPRLLELHDDLDIPATFFVPGHTIDSFPSVCEEIWDTGHDIQHHGWSHRNPQSFDGRDEEEEDIIRGIESIKELTGRAPSGYRSPAWDHSSHTLDILRDNGFEWDSSLMGTDFRPYYVPDNWGGEQGDTYDRGDTSEVVELPVNWQRDDFPQLEFIWKKFVLWGFADEEMVFEKWRAQFDWMYENVDDGVFILTMHPQSIGRAPRIGYLRDLLDEFRSKDVEFRLMDDVAESFRK